MIPGGEYTAPTAIEAEPVDRMGNAPGIQTEKPAQLALWQVVSRNARRLPGGTWLTIGLVAIAGGTLLFSWNPEQPQAPVAEIPKQELVPQTQERYDRSGVIEESVATLNDVQNQYSLFLNEEQQRLVGSYASAFQAQAARFAALRGHPCSSATVTLVRCLKSFDKNRDEHLRVLRSESERAEFDNKPTKQVVDPMESLDKAGKELYRIMGLRLAIALATPAEQRSNWQQTWLEQNFPVLLDPDGERRLQHSLHLAQRRTVKAAEAEMESLSPNAAARQQEEEDCFALPLDEQPEEGC